MNKYELITSIAKTTGASKAKTAAMLNATLDTIMQTIVHGGTVQLIGFGSFVSSGRIARLGRNPRTGQVLKIAATKTVKFSAGTAFKDVVNQHQ